MEDWYTKLRELKDVSESPHLTREVAFKMFYLLKRMKIKEKVKFKQRMGPEFDGFVSRLSEYFPSETVIAILQEDDFWELTLARTQGF